VGFRFDNWGRANVPTSLQSGISRPLLVFTNSNNQVSIRNLATPSAENTTEILYFVDPAAPSNRLEVVRLNVATQDQIYLAPNGRALAYFLVDGGRSGLYILNIENALSGRIAAINSIVQRGINSSPTWSPDGEFLAVTLETGYALDIFAYDRGGAGRSNLTNHPAYDMFPSWSPDGRLLAFVSDRDTCPSWTPGDPGACDALTTPPPLGGYPYLYDVQTGQTRRLAEVFTSEAPRWLNERLLTFAGGNQSDLLKPQRTLWIADVQTNSVRQVLAQGDEGALYLAEAWSKDGNLVFVQRAYPDRTDLVILTASGAVREVLPDLSFPRFGVSAAWSPTGERYAIGGKDGQCPYGVRVFNRESQPVARGNPPPSMCNPIFSPDGSLIAFTGVNPNVDGRLDIYTSTANGFGAQNLTADLRGRMTLIGWISAQNP
jgi:Tol biopolymer transport system component